MMDLPKSPSVRVGATFPGGYLIRQELREPGFRGIALRAEDVDGQPVVLRVFNAVLSTEYGHCDVRPGHAALAPALGELVALPAAPGRAPWLRHVYDPERGYTLLVRRWLSQPVLPALAGAEGAALVRALGPLAEALDGLGAEVSVSIDPGNLFLDEGRVVLTDFGLRPLIKVTLDGDPGPHRIHGGWTLARLQGWRDEPGRPYWLAALYCQLRARALPFRHEDGLTVPTSCVGIRDGFEADQAAQRSRHTGDLDLDFAGGGERSVLQRALGTGEGFASCAALVTALGRALG